MRKSVGYYYRTMALSMPQPKRTKGISISYIFELIEKLTEIKRFVIISSSQKREIAWLRFMICYIFKTKTNLSLSQIGEVVNRDHSTVLNACNCFENEFLSKKPVQVTIDYNIIELYNEILSKL